MLNKPTHDFPSGYHFNPIAVVNSPYKEKFAIPRQPNLVSAAHGTLSFLKDANNEALVRGLESFTHIWVIFAFHQTAQQGWKPLVRPPRLGGNKKMGVLATRSTFRPNPIGMSVIKLDQIIWKNNQLTLAVSGLDLLDGTPVLDIKPYIPYADAMPEAHAGFAQSVPEASLQVIFSDDAINAIGSYTKQYPDLLLFIEQVLAQDPRPAYKKQTNDTDKIYGMQLYDLNIQWRMLSLTEVEVLSIDRITKG